jgi:hypothetical protein
LLYHRNSFLYFCDLAFWHFVLRCVLFHSFWTSTSKKVLRTFCLLTSITQTLEKHVESYHAMDKKFVLLIFLETSLWFSFWLFEKKFMSGVVRDDWILRVRSRIKRCIFSKSFFWVWTLFIICIFCWWSNVR